MPPSAHTALVVSIIASALGALVMCLLVARYGLAPAGGEDGHRGLLVTRFGHALAGVCFAATGILTVVALSQPAREPRPAPTTIVKVEPDRAAEARVQALAAEMKTLAARLEQAEARMTGMDSTARRLDQAEARMTAMDSAARRLGDEVGSINAHAKQLERMIAAISRRPVVAEPAPKPAPAPAPAEVPAAPPAPVPATPPPGPDPVATPKPRTPEPVAHRPLPPPARAAEPAASPRVGPSSGRATIEAPPRSVEGGAAVAKPDDLQLTDKIREDWKTIRGGLSTAGDDFKAAVRDLGRKLWR